MCDVEFTRRSLLARLAASGAVGAWASAAEPAERMIQEHRMGTALLQLTNPDGRPVPPGRVAAVAQTRHQFLFGCNIFLYKRIQEPDLQAAYRARFAELFNYATLPFFWRTFEPESGDERWEQTDPIVGFCRQHKITPRGQTLCYNINEPHWLPADPEEVRKVLVRRIHSVLDHYRGQVGYWDVVNEAVRWDTAAKRESAPHFTHMIEALGLKRYLRMSFRNAREADPDTSFLINDYMVGPQYLDKVLSLIDGTENQRPIYDVIGLQAHQHGGAWPRKRIIRVCDLFTAMRRPVQITETTFVSGRLQNTKSDPRESWDSTPDCEERQARDVELFYTTVFSRPGVEALTWWDLSDYGAWKGAPGGLLRKDMTPKPAYNVLKHLIKEKWTTHSRTETGRHGELRFRGFFGDYAVTLFDGEREYSGVFSFPRPAIAPIVVKLV